MVLIGFACSSRAGVAEPPVNDAFDHAIELVNGAWTFDNSLATTNDSIAGCAPHGRDIWFKYQCSCDGILRITTCGSSFDTVLLVHNGWNQPTNQNLLRCDDDAQLANCDSQSLVEIRVVRNQKILINVSGAGRENPSGGKGRLTIACIDAAGGCCVANDTPGCEHPDCAAAVCAIDPFCCETSWDSDCGVLANRICTECIGEFRDDCAHAASIVNGFYKAVGNFGDTTDGPATPHCGQFQADQWYNYIATCTGTLTVQTTKATFACMLALYDGWDCPPQNLLACRAGSNDAMVAAQVQAGQRIKIRLGGKDGDTGTATLIIRCVPGPDELDPKRDRDPQTDDSLRHSVDRCPLVNLADSFCCEGQWDQLCTELAGELCRP